jgi:serine/threonine protein kinase
VILIVGNFVFVVVRDLKMDNIFLMKDDMVKIGDFGISKLLSTASHGDKFTVSGNSIVERFVETLIKKCDYHSMRVDEVTLILSI